MKQPSLFDSGIVCGWCGKDPGLKHGSAAFAELTEPVCTGDCKMDAFVGVRVCKVCRWVDAVGV